MKFIFKIIFFLLVGNVFLACGISKSLQNKPLAASSEFVKPNIEKKNDSLFISGENFLIKNKQQLWELHVSGNELQRGLLIGGLSEDLFKKQEHIFFSKIREMVPSAFKQKLVRQFLKWYNRKLYLHIPEEFKTEIYGVSEYASEDFNTIAPKYLRSLYLHGAHDIGHALQDLALVGCSSMAVWGDKSEDGTLLIGRNFDFYAGDDFAEDKIIQFIKPEKGIPFMNVSWGGMIGVLSGMNVEGLTVTINAGKSDIPLVAKTPISIVTREILQYASTIDEAIAIAKKREVFVSESIMVGSAKDKKAVLIEMAPDNFDVYEVANSSQLVCSNHFQSKAYQSDERNLNHIKESHSQYRFKRMVELLSENDKMNPKKMADILRNKKGLDERNIGFGNEKALNQLRAHHAVIFKPEELMVWVSSNPYQLGEFVAYDLKEVFSKTKGDFTISAKVSQNIPKDKFLETKEYRDYERFRILDRKLDTVLKEKLTLEKGFAQEYKSLNPDFWLVYARMGEYYYQNGWLKAAEIEFKKALEKEITTVLDRIKIENYLKKINRKIE
ncbi:C45 family autoproteolytic acyltransferase/hydolase [Flavobacterium sp.]|uniref:C45 family autoproteolytic acyltransferase/hydolase n=1 Tax=Flavobacterium sp. TaxID=239 RepID=UPI0035280950